MEPTWLARKARGLGDPLCAGQVVDLDLMVPTDSESVFADAISLLDTVTDKLTEGWAAGNITTTDVRAC